jgi:hypothetical protein
MPTATLSSDINLAHHTHLRRISLLVDDDYELEENVEGALTSLSWITSPQVDHVSLQIYLETLSDLNEVDWARVEHILTQQ